MNLFCKNHQKEKVILFCISQNCTKNKLLCSECLNSIHPKKDHDLCDIKELNNWVKQQNDKFQTMLGEISMRCIRILNTFKEIHQKMSNIKLNIQHSLQFEMITKIINCYLIYQQFSNKISEFEEKNLAKLLNCENQQNQDETKDENPLLEDIDEIKQTENNLIQLPDSKQNQNFNKIINYCFKQEHYKSNELFQTLKEEYIQTLREVYDNQIQYISQLKNEIPLYVNTFKEENNEANDEITQLKEEQENFFQWLDQINVKQQEQIEEFKNELNPFYDKMETNEQEKIEEQTETSINECPNNENQFKDIDITNENLQQLKEEIIKIKKNNQQLQRENIELQNQIIDLKVEQMEMTDSYYKNIKLSQHNSNDTNNNTTEQFNQKISQLTKNYNTQQNKYILLMKKYENLNIANDVQQNKQQQNIQQLLQPSQETQDLIQSQLIRQKTSQNFRRQYSYITRPSSQTKLNPIASDKLIKSQKQK